MSNHYLGKQKKKILKHLSNHFLLRLGFIKWSNVLYMFLQAIQFLQNNENMSHAYNFNPLQPINTEKFTLSHLNSLQRLVYQDPAINSTAAHQNQMRLLQSNGNKSLSVSFFTIVNWRSGSQGKTWLGNSIQWPSLDGRSIV